jgi:hypothetical protein
MTKFRLFQVGLALHLAANLWILISFRYESHNSRLPYGHWEHWEMLMDKVDVLYYYRIGAFRYFPHEVQQYNF